MKSTKACGSTSAGWTCVPVPGTQPRYSTAYDLAEAYHARRDATDTIDVLDVRREALEKQALLRWLDRRDAPASFLLMRSNLFDRYARELAGRVTPVLRESGLGRKELVLLRVRGQRAPRRVRSARPEMIPGAAARAHRDGRLRVGRRAQFSCPAGRAKLDDDRDSAVSSRGVAPILRASFLV